MPFESPDWDLGDLLKDVSTGDVQLPDFQRDWKWDDERISSLLATVTLGYPMGVVMTLEMGGDGARFKPRPLSGVELAGKREPEQLLLDGQQRMTSLFQALKSGRPVQTMDSRGKQLTRWYYIDMAAALADPGDRDEAIVSVPEDRVVREQFGREVKADYSTRELECAADMFPLGIVFDHVATTEWLLEYVKEGPEKRQRWMDFQSKVLQNITAYKVPVIRLTKDTPKEAVCTVFEKVNTGGVPLNVFELLTATFAGENWYRQEHGDDFRLNDDWQRIRRTLADHRVLASFENTDFLQVVSLLTTWHRRRGVSCKKKDVLKLTLRDYLDWSEKVVQALLWAARFLWQEHIYKADDLPYRTQLVPLAAIRVVLGEQKADVYAINTRLRRWYWCGVLGELYGGSTETRFARDLEQVVAWIEEGP